MGGPRLVQWSRFSDAFQRLFGLQGNTALNVVDDVFLTLPVEEDAAHLAYLRGWHRFAVSGAAGAVAAQFGNVILAPQAPVLCVVDSIIVSMQNIGRARFGIKQTNAALVSCPLLDDREPQQAGGTRQTAVLGVLAANNAAAQLGATFPLTGYMLASDSLVQNGSTPLLPVGAVLTIAPGATQASCLMVEAETVNMALWVTFFGRYRELTQQESR